MLVASPRACAQVDGQMCSVEYLARGAQINVALNPSATVSVREAVLGSLCTKCFREIQRIRAQNFRLLRKYDRQPELCLVDTTKYGSSP